MSKNLVELMAEKLNDKYTFSPSFNKAIAEQMLSVVKEHIGEVAMPCSCLDTDTLKPFIHCNECKGTGVIARTEGDV
jgi:hypothetical protein